jgi:hypothetical protein
MYYIVFIFNCLELGLSSKHGTKNGSPPLDVLIKIDLQGTLYHLKELKTALR